MLLKVSPQNVPPHYARGFKELVEKIWDENKWIKTIYPLPYHKQKKIKKGIHFYVEEGENGYRLIGSYKPDDFGNRFEIIANVSTIEELSYAVLQLEKRYGSD